MLLCREFVGLCYYVVCLLVCVIMSCVFVGLCYYAVGHTSHMCLYVCVIMLCLSIVDMTGSCPHNTESGFVVLVGRVSILVLTHNHLPYWTFYQLTFHQLCAPNV